MKIIIQKYSQVEEQYKITNFSKHLVSNFVDPKKIYARYLAHKQTGIFFEEKYFRENTFFSSSYSGDFVAVATNNNKIGIDIETYKTRDISVFSYHLDQEYKLFGVKNLKNFYRLWAIKESIIKYLGLVLDNINEIEIISVQKQEMRIDDIYFQYKIISRFQDKEVLSFQGNNDILFYSLTADL